MWGSTLLCQQSFLGEQLELEAFVVEEFVEIRQVKAGIDPDPAPAFVFLVIELSPEALFELDG